MVRQNTLSYRRRPVRKNNIMVGGAISGFLILICAFLVLCIKIGFYGGYADNGTAISREISRETAVIITDTLPWNLILVNKWNPLPERQRTVLVLRTVEGLSYEEIAERTGINYLTCRVLLSQARSKIRSKV